MTDQPYPSPDPFPQRLVLRCGGCETIMGMIEPSAQMAGKAAWAFCDYRCLKKVRDRGEANSKASIKRGEIRKPKGIVPPVMIDGVPFPPIEKSSESAS